MKVIFLQHVLNVAKVWEIKEVSSGYASNFLFPKKLAKAYSKEIWYEIASIAQKKESDKRVLLWKKQEIIDAISGQVIEIEALVSGQKIQGSINQKDVAEIVAKKFKYPLTKKHIDFWGVHSSLKHLGDHEVYIDLWENFAAKMIVRIIEKS